MCRTNVLVIYGVFLLASLSEVAYGNEPKEAPSAKLAEELSREFRLDGPRAEEERFYESTTEMTRAFKDGKTEPAGTFRLFLQATPVKKDKDNKPTFQYSCRGFVLESADGKKQTVPALEKFTYQIEPGIDAKKQVMGIEHSKFFNLKDAAGNNLQLADPYLVYNTFIDYHGFNDSIATVGLRRIGDSVDMGGRQELPVHLGDSIKEGSVYRLGDGRRRLDGIGLVNKQPCAIVAFDSDDSSFLMKLDMPNMKMDVEGYSRFEGNVQIELASNWPASCKWKEIIITQAKKADKVVPNSEQIMLRVGTILALSKQDFEKRLEKVQAEK